MPWLSGLLKALTLLKKYFHACRSLHNPEIQNQVSSANRLNSHARHLEGRFSLHYHYRQH